MGVTTCGMCNQQKTYSGCGCVTTRKPCKTSVASILVNGQVTNQETIEFLGSCLGTNIEQDGCGHKLQISIPCVAYNEATSILTIETPEGTQEIDLSSLGDLDVYVNQGMFDGSNILLTDTNNNTISVDISGLASGYTANADGSFTLTSGNGVDTITIPAECCTVSVELNGLNLETTDSLGNTIVTDLSTLVSEITANGDGTWTHSAWGVDTIIDTNHTVVLTGTDLEVTNADGDVQTIDLSSFLSTFTANANGTFTHSAGGVDTVLPAQVIVDGATLSPTGVLTITQTNGAADVVVDLASLISEEGINTALTLIGTVLTVTDDAGAQSVDLAPLLATLADNVVNNVTLTGTVLTVSTSGGANFPIDFSSIIPAQCCNDSAVLDASGNLIITQTNGPDVSVNLTPLLATLTDDVVTTVTFVNDVLTIATAGGATFTSDLSSLEKCCNTGAVVGADNVLTITQDNGPDVTVDFTPILTADNISYDNTASGSPATNTQSAIDDLYAKICTDGFIVNAGTTALSADNSLGEETVECGDILHFWSPDGTVDFNVTPGSAVVDADVNIPAILSADAGNSAVVGTDGNIFVAPVTPGVNTDLSIGTVTATNVPVLSSDGADIATLPGATAATAGIITATTQTIGWEKTIDSGTDDVSGLTLNRLDGNTAPIAPCAPLLGIDPLTWEVGIASSWNGYVYTFIANDVSAMVANGATISPANSWYITNSAWVNVKGSELTFTLDCTSIVEFKVDVEQSIRSDTIADGTPILFQNRIVVDWVGTGAFSNTNEFHHHSTNATTSEVRKSLHLIRTVAAGTHTVSYFSNLFQWGDATMDWQNTQVMLSAKWMRA